MTIPVSCDLTALQDTSSIPSTARQQVQKKVFIFTARQQVQKKVFIYANGL